MSDLYIFEAGTFAGESVFGSHNNERIDCSIVQVS